MKNYIFSILFICVTSISVAQINEIGLVIGGSNYVGDIGRTNYIYPSALAGGLIYKWNLNPRIAFRGNLNYLPITAKDSQSENIVRKERDLKFNNTIHELAVGIEYNFYEYDLSNPEKSSTPYILLQAAAINYKNASSEITVGTYNYSRKTTFSIPFGVGFKGALSGNFAYAIETKFTYLLEDDLDYSTKRISSLNFGNNTNDWYVFTGFSIVYTFGRPACYSEPK